MTQKVSKFFEQAICVADWASPNFGGGKGIAVVLDMMPTRDEWRLYIHDGSRRQPDVFYSKNVAEAAFEKTVRDYKKSAAPQGRKD